MSLPDLEQFDRVLDGGLHLVERSELKYAMDIVLSDGQIGSWQTHLAELRTVGAATDGSDVIRLRQLLPSASGEVDNLGHFANGIGHVAVLALALDVKLQAW